MLRPVHTWRLSLCYNQSLTLCQKSNAVVDTENGFRPILCICISVTIVAMLNFDGDGDCDVGPNADVKCEQSITVAITNVTRVESTLKFIILSASTH